MSSLLETVIVIALISILSIFSIINIVEFQKNAALDSAAKELASTIETARSQSIAGVIVEGTDESFYEDDYLPEFGVSVESDKYSLTSTYRKAGDVSDTLDLVVSTNISTNLVLSPVSTINFDRITGNSTGTSSFTVMQVSGTQGRQVNVSSEGVEIIKI